MQIDPRQGGERDHTPWTTAEAPPRRTPGAELPNIKNKYPNLINEARHVAVSKSIAKANKQQTNGVIANITA